MGDSLVDKVKNAMPQEEDLIEVAELFKAFGDPTRAKIICALSQSELCVGDLALLLEMNQSAGISPASSAETGQTGKNPERWQGALLFPGG